MTKRCFRHTFRALSAVPVMPSSELLLWPSHFSFKGQHISWSELYPHLQVQWVTYYSAELTAPKLHKVFAWERQIYQVPGTLATAPWLQPIYLTLNAKRKEKKGFQGQNIVFHFLMNNATAAVWNLAFCPNHSFSVIRILVLSSHLSPTLIGRYLTIQ